MVNMIHALFTTLTIAIQHNYFFLHLYVSLFIYPSIRPLISICLIVLSPSLAACLSNLLPSFSSFSSFSLFPPSLCLPCPGKSNYIANLKNKMSRHSYFLFSTNTNVLICVSIFTDLPVRASWYRLPLSARVGGVEGVGGCVRM